MINTYDSETSHLSQTGCEEPVFESVVRRRTIRYYIGNIGLSSNRAGLLQFLKEHGVVPIGMRMIETHRGHLSAKITVNASDRYTVEYDIPWPKKMYCRRWLGKQQWSSRLDHTDYYDENDYHRNENKEVDLNFQNETILLIHTSYINHTSNDNSFLQHLDMERERHYVICR